MDAVGKLPTNGVDVPAGLMDMPKYRSHKTVWALEIASIEEAGFDSTTDENRIIVVHFVDSHFAPKRINLYGKPTPQAGWYMVQYEDGYISFSPKQQFEEGNALESSMVQGATIQGIGWAVKQMQNGSKVRRAGWNGKGMFVFLVPGSQFKVSRAPLNAIYPEGTEITYRPHIDLKSPDGTIGTWAPSIHDTLATDWEIAA